MSRSHSIRKIFICNKYKGHIKVAVSIQTQQKYWIKYSYKVNYPSKGVLLNIHYCQYYFYPIYFVRLA